MNRLFVEWVLIALVICGLFFAEGRPHTLEVDQEQRRNSSRGSWRKEWMRKFRIPIVTLAAISAIGLGYYASRRIVRELPNAEVSKVVVEQGYIDANGSMVLDIYNGSDFVLTEIRISISVFDDKRNAIISNRIYRVPANYFYPQQSKKVFADVGFTIAQDQQWELLTVGAKGRPE